jgi:hypothetical protein
MSRSTPPQAFQPRIEIEPNAIDSGWSAIPPAPSPQRVEESAFELAPTERSGLKRLAPKGRADGTLLGVAPPQAETPSAPQPRSPVVVHAGVVPAEVVRGVADATVVEALPTPVAPAARRPPPAPPVEMVRTPPALPITQQLDDAAAVSAVQQPVLKALVAPDVATRQRDPQLPGVGAAMRARVRFAGMELQLWRVLVPSVGALGVAVVGIAVATAWRFTSARHLTDERVVPAASPSVQANSPEPLSAAPSPADLARKPPESLSAEDVLTLATIASEKQRDAAKLFHQRLVRDPSSVKNKAVIAELRKLTADPDTAHEALAAAAELPGPQSGDLLYELWTATPGRTDVTELARALAYSRDVRAKSSEALSVALDLRLAETCAANQALLPRATQTGDRRSLQLLTKLQRKQGCGPKKSADCFACLREDDELEAAIAAVKARRPPNPFGP